MSAPSPIRRAITRSIADGTIRDLLRELLVLHPGYAVLGSLFQHPELVVAALIAAPLALVGLVNLFLVAGGKRPARPLATRGRPRIHRYEVAPSPAGATS